MKALISPSKKILLALTLFSLPSISKADTYASLQRKDAALGHYARARSMLVEALAEFEQGRKFARPDMLIDPEEWRLSIISRTEEINRILDPKPRVTRGGVAFRANKLLIRREKQRPAVVEDGAKDNNLASENQKYLSRIDPKNEKNNSRASLTAVEQGEISNILENQDKGDKAKHAAVDKLINEEVKKANAEKESMNKETAKIKEELPKTSNAKIEVVPTIKEEKIAEKTPAVDSIVPPPVEEMKKEDSLAAKKNIITEEESVVDVTRGAKEENKTDLLPQEDEQSKLVVEDDEEVVARGRVDSNVDNREDEITRKIEKALQDRMKQEKAISGGSGEAPANADFGGN